MLELPAPEDDGLKIPVVGSWSADKHHFLRRYIDAFTTAMKSKPWSGLHYIDLFAGAGIERIKGGNLDWGSPLIAAQAPHPFTQLHLCELSKKRHDALAARLDKIKQPNKPQLIEGDANLRVADVVAALPPRSLSLAFLDPHGLHLHYTTLQCLSQRRVDLVVSFPDHLDALRNWERYHNDPDSNLDAVLGSTLWRAEAEKHPERRADLLTRIYIEQIRKLGYSAFERERISMPNGRFLYKLIFCSMHEVAATIWRRVSQRKPDGQGSLDFG